jgi:hypothetical protein
MLGTFGDARHYAKLKTTYEETAITKTHNTGNPEVNAHFLPPARWISNTPFGRGGCCEERSTGQLINPAFLSG